MKTKQQLARQRRSILTPIERRRHTNQHGKSIEYKHGLKHHVIHHEMGAYHVDHAHPDRAGGADYGNFVHKEDAAAHMRKLGYKRFTASMIDDNHLRDRVNESELDAEDRSKLRSKTFGLPAQRKYPMPDREHAANAKARAKQQLDAGHLSPEDYKKIVSKADGILNEVFHYQSVPGTMSKKGQAEMYAQNANAARENGDHFAVMKFQLAHDEAMHDHHAAQEGATHRIMQKHYKDAVDGGREAVARNSRLHEEATSYKRKSHAEKAEHFANEAKKHKEGSFGYHYNLERYHYNMSHIRAHSSNRSLHLKKHEYHRNKAMFHPDKPSSLQEEAEGDQTKHLYRETSSHANGSNFMRILKNLKAKLPPAPEKKLLTETKKSD